MKHVGADDEIERAGSNPCSVPGFSRSKILRFDFGEGRELLHARREESGGDVGESVGV